MQKVLGKFFSLSGGSGARGHPINLLGGDKVWVTLHSLSMVCGTHCHKQWGVVPNLEDFKRELDEFVEGEPVCQ